MTYDELILKLRTDQLAVLGQHAARDHQSVEPIVRKAGHDVRSALSGIVGYAALIEHSAIDIKTKDRAGRIGQASEMLTRTADSMVHDVRHRTSDEALVATSAGEIVNSILAALDAETLNLTLRSDLCGAIPDRLVADVDRLRAIIVDLILSLLPAQEVDLVMTAASGEVHPADTTTCSVSAAVDEPGPTPVADYLLLLSGSTRRSRSEGGRSTHEFDFSSRSSASPSS